MRRAQVAIKFISFSHGEMMKNAYLIFLSASALCISSHIALANNGDFSGGVAIGSSYAGVATAPTNGLIIQGAVGIGTLSPVVSLDDSKNTDAIAVPVGTTGQEPSSPTVGMIRYNTTTGQFEGYGGSTPAWMPLNSIASTMPSGSVIMWATDTAPAGYLECDGSAVSRTTYANLFAAIGTTFGSGDGSTTFNLPDMRGYFPRGWADGGIIDSGRSFGSTQLDAMQGHVHSSPGGYFVLGGLSGGAGFGGSQSSGSAYNTGDPISDGINGTPRIASETRPVNLALMFCIKE